MAAALLAAHLPEAHVQSAGFLDPGEPAVDEVVRVMADRGYDLSEHRSQRVTPELAQGADLIVAMMSQHIVELTGVARETWTRAFTIKDLARRPPRHKAESVRAWAERLSDGRTPRDVLLSPVADDVEDPMGGTRGDFVRTVEELEILTSKLAYAINGSGASSSMP